MSEEQPAKWAVGLTDEFTYQINVGATAAELERQKKRADQAEKSLKKYREAVSDARRLRIGKLAGKVRKRGGKGAAKKASPNAATSDNHPLSPDQMVDLRANALNGRLRVVLAEYSRPTSSEAPLSQSIEMLATLLDEHPKDKPLAWLTYIAVMAKYPMSEDILRFSTDVQVNGAPMALAQLLRLNSELPASWAQSADLELVRDVVVDPTATSHRDFHTGIQRVVRESVPRWARKAPIRLMIWSGLDTYHLPSPLETWRVMAYVPRAKNALDKTFPSTIPVPWKTVVIVPEPTGQQGRAEALSCLGEWSGNELCAIFYDVIMYTLPESLMDSSRIGLTNYIPTIRTSRRVSTISHAVADDLRHFVEGFRGVGLPVPAVAAQPLPMVAEELSDAAFEANEPRLTGVPGVPLVLSVGSLEPRKNQIMTLRAAERLWQEGHQFQLLYIGWGSWRADDIIAEIERSQDRGRPVRIVRRADEDLLWAAYRAAHFSIYISVAEGYGLPIGESIAAGTPAITSNYGSMAEVAAAGGVVTVNPRDLDEVADAMRTLLTNPDELAALAEQARSHSQSTWDDYADQTWKWLVDGEG